MFINFKIYQKHNLTPELLIQLIAIRQKEVSVINTDILSRFEEVGYISYVKGKKDQDKRELVRLSDKGKKIVRELTTDSKDYMVALKVGEKRGHFRSKTYPGIAKAVAEQWGQFLRK